MFEDFRKQIEGEPFDDRELEEDPLAGAIEREHHFLGMTPPQRFLVALMLLMMTVVIGTFFLLVSSKIVLPFLAQ